MVDKEYKNTYSQQGFSLEVPYILDLIKLIKERDSFTAKGLAKRMGVGYPKVACFIQYAKILGLLDDDRNITNFGRIILNIGYSYDYLYSLLYYRLVKGSNNGAHLYFSKIVNEILYDVSFQLNNKILLKDLKIEMLDYNIRNIDENDHYEYTRRAINTLSNPSTGFGKLGMVKKIEDNYEIYSYWPEPLICAYIIYDCWEEGAVAMKIDDIIKGHYNFGRIFFLDEDTVIGILEDLQQMEYISVETIAGLNQIAINPKKSKSDILEAIVDEA
jgi:hypothetical protein